MTRQIRVRSVRKRELDEDKLAMAFILLARILVEQQEAGLSRADSGKPRQPSLRKAAS
jgi:hypothetical protein